MEYVEAGGTEIPKLGFGTFQTSGTSCHTAVEAALDCGYRHVDTAEYYGNETAVGAAIRESPVDREEVFLTTKVWRSNLRSEDVVRAAEASLDRLGVEYVDLLLVHWPHPRIPIEETLAAMDELRDRGVTRHIGVSNFTREQLSEAQSVAEADVVTNQVLYHPYIDQRRLRDYCVETGTALTAYSPLARGSVLGDETLERIGGRYDKSPPQVALRWLVQQPGVVAIPRSSSPEHIAENAAVFDFELADEEMREIHELSGGLAMRLRNKLPSLVRSFPL
ncbi:aldehyde oxidoreductase [Halobacteriales archaeon QH_2_65_14]|nr:MAG: aldehyde oxidoreductase [Halobacteriales archaeon QH_2_65_14]